MSKPLPSQKNLTASISSIIAALAIMVVFILTATYLRSVFFGLVVAFFVLPLQQFFYRKLFSKPRYMDMMERKSKFADRLYHQHKATVPLELRARRAAASHSAIFTFLIVLVGTIFLGLFLLAVSVQGLGQAGRSLRDYSNRVVAEEQAINHNEQEDARREMLKEMGANPLLVSDIPVSMLDSEHERSYIESLVAGLSRKLEGYRESLSQCESLKPIFTTLSDVLKKQDNQEKLSVFLVEKLREYFPSLFGIFSSSIQVITDVALTLVFCALFLQIFAKTIVSATYYYEVEGEKSNLPQKTDDKPFSYYLFALMFSSAWFPNLSESARAEAMQILEEVVKKLRAWVRGYFLVVSIEVPLYILIFSFIGVPYPFLIGLLSGCTIFIPFLGPVLVFGSTFLVMFASSDVSAIQILLVALTYLCVWGGLENLFLYPKLVGGSLGLSFIETLSVVLLGGYLFGIPGLILALPTAAVLKYLIPQMWRCWAGEKQTVPYLDENDSCSS